ncbi:uncharacterized protein LOC128557250 [Mercenaria mercenaria]|uniref:uncharacterized protein LOC128557250 n=1 Tax=Mercenaria mercenaria TaxID=6596 RepID=UPI00234E7C02|nr:uncharacterized protein LOC128557250 [Mercenaria mercenaria]
MSDKEFQEIIKQTRNAMKNAATFEKDLINKNIKELQEAWRKGSKSEVSVFALEIKSTIESKFGSTYTDLTRKLKALHKKVPDVRPPPPKSSRSEDKLTPVVSKSEIHSRKGKSTEKRQVCFRIKMY